MTGWSGSPDGWLHRAAERIGLSAAGLEVMALAAVRATREATVEEGGAKLPVIVGVADRG